MNRLLHAARHGAGALIRDDDGAQVVEYALIIAVISIALLIGLKGLIDIPIPALVDKVVGCLTGTCSS